MSSVENRPKKNKNQIYTVLLLVDNCSSWSRTEYCLVERQTRVDQSRRSPRPIFHQPKTSTICAPRRWQSIIWRLEASDSSWFVSVLSSFHVISIHFNFYIRVRQFDAHSNSYKLTVKRQETFILSIMSSVRPLLSAGLSLIYSSALLAFVQWSRCFRLVERDKAPLSPSSAFGQRGGTATLCRYSRCEA